MLPNTLHLQISLLLTFHLLTLAHPRNIATPPPDDAISNAEPSLLPRSPIFPIGLSLPIILPAPAAFQQTTTITHHSTITRTSTVHATTSATSFTSSSDPVETAPTGTITFTPGLESVTSEAVMPPTTSAADGAITSVDIGGSENASTSCSSGTESVATTMSTMLRITSIPVVMDAEATIIG